MPDSSDPAIVLGLYVAAPRACMGHAEDMARELSLSLLKPPPQSLAAGDYVLQLGSQGLGLVTTGRKQAGEIRVDFACGTARHRRHFGGGKGQMIAKAVGLKGSYKPTVLDLTAGLGQDGFVLASLGCSVCLVERHPVIYALLQDGLARAQRHVQDSGDAQLGSIVAAIKTVRKNALDYLAAMNGAVDVIYLDPMFPPREKSAKVKKAMQAFHRIVGTDDDAGLVLQQALKKADYRVVVKRPRLAPNLAEQYPQLDLPPPSYSLEGKSGRFDIYTRQKMPTVL